MASTLNDEDNAKFTNKQNESHALERIYDNGTAEGHHALVALVRLFQGDQFTDTEGYNKYKKQCRKYHKQSEFQKAESLSRVVDLQQLFNYQKQKMANTMTGVEISCDYEEKETTMVPEQELPTICNLRARYLKSQFILVPFIITQLKGSKVSQTKIQAQIKDHTLITKYENLDLDTWNEDIVHAMKDIINYYGGALWSMVHPVVDETDEQQMAAVTSAIDSHNRNGYHLLRLIRGTLIGGVSDLGQVQTQMLQVPIANTQAVSKQLAEIEQLVTRAFTCIEETNSGLTAGELIHGNLVHKIRTALYDNPSYQTIIKESYTKYPDAYKEPTKTLADLKRVLKLQDLLKANQRSTATTQISAAATVTNQIHQGGVASRNTFNKNAKSTKDVTTPEYLNKHFPNMEARNAINNGKGPGHDHTGRYGKLPVHVCQYRDMRHYIMHSDNIPWKDTVDPATRWAENIGIFTKRAPDFYAKRDAEKARGEAKWIKNKKQKTTSQKSEHLALAAAIATAMDSNKKSEKKKAQKARKKKEHAKRKRARDERNDKASERGDSDDYASSNSESESDEH